MTDKQAPEELAEAELDHVAGGAAKFVNGLTSRFSQGGQQLDSTGSSNPGSIKAASPINAQGDGSTRPA